MYPSADGKEMEAKNIRGEMEVMTACATRKVGTPVSNVKEM